MTSTSKKFVTFLGQLESKFDFNYMISFPRFTFHTFITQCTWGKVTKEHALDPRIRQKLELDP